MYLKTQDPRLSRVVIDQRYLYLLHYLQHEYVWLQFCFGCLVICFSGVELGISWGHCDR